MKFFLNRVRSQRGFTMVEIALCLAIVGFAMVVIMGVLPLGSQVQKNNRENTLSLMDGNYVLEAIVNGARGYDDLGLYVDEILLYSSPKDEKPTRVIENNLAGQTHWGTREIVGLISAPQFLLTSSNVWVPNYLNNSEILGNNAYTNMVCKLKMRSMNGTAADKYTDENNRDFGMAYLVEVQVLPVETNSVNLNDLKDNNALKEQMEVERSLSLSTYQVALTLGWPLRKGEGGGYKVGNHSQYFRTLVTGTLSNEVHSVEVPSLGVRDVNFWYFNKNEFSVTNNSKFYDELAR